MLSKGDLTRQKIIEKSMQLFSVHGYFHTTIDGIVKAAGLTKGGLYGHFHNKQEIWQAVYDECVRLWKKIIFQGVREISDPLARIQRVMENSLKDYLGGEVFEGGCFMLNSLVELAGQSPDMCTYVLAGFKSFARLFHSWLQEAEQQGRLKEGINIDEVAEFIVVALNGAAPLYAASKDAAVWQQTLAQLNFYLESLKRPNAANHTN